MLPRVGCRNLVSRLKQVVLPAPLGPISAWMVPRSIRRLTPLTATKPAKSFVRSSVSRMNSLIHGGPSIARHLEAVHGGRPDPQKSQGQAKTPPGWGHPGGPLRPARGEGGGVRAGHSSEFDL